MKIRSGPWLLGVASCLLISAACSAPVAAGAKSARTAAKAPGPLLLKQIPKEFRGEFSVDLEDCGSEGDDGDRIWVDAAEVGSYEAIKNVETVRITAMGLIIRYKPWSKRYAEAGFDLAEMPEPPERLEYSPDRRTLNKIYRKCPPSRD